MAFSQNSRSKVSYIAETVFGTTPTGTSPVGDFQEINKTSFGMELTKERVQGNDLQSDRMTRVDRHGNKSTSGDLVVDLRADEYDSFLEAAMLNSFSTTTLKTGVTPKFFTFEEYAVDIDQARIFTGTTVTSASFSIAPNQMVTSTFGLVGKTMTAGATESPQLAAGLGTNAPFDSFSGAMAIGNVGASAGVNNISSLEFSINNGFNPDFVIGSDSAPNLNYGMSVVEGSFTAYYEDLAFLNRFLNEVETEIEVSVDDPTAANAYTFLFPRVKINGAAIPVGGEGSRLITMPFVALYDTTETSNLVITRPA